MTSPIRVVVADDHGIVRRGIRALLGEQSDIVVVGEASNGAAAVAETLRLRPDVLVTDLVMPGMDGIEVIRRIHADLPSTRILVLTSFASDDKLFPAIRAGAHGYLLKDSEPEDLIAAIRRVHRGEVSLHPDIARKVLQEIGHAVGQPAPTTALSEREVEVLHLAARGWSNQQIAGELRISEATVRTHMSNILSKLHLASRTQAVLYALREGLASLNESAESS
jgi:NarL family two-component system response regulator LiaR